MVRWAGAAVGIDTNPTTGDQGCLFSIGNVDGVICATLRRALSEFWPVIQGRSSYSRYPR